MRERLVTVRTFNFPAEVTIVQTFMEMKGIDIYMKNLVNNSLAYPLADIEMQVKSSDYEKARDALIEGGFATAADF